MAADTEMRSTDDDYRGSVDDEFRSILEGLRTTLPGAQALFGFLLILPFQGSFGELSFVPRTAYYTAFIAAAVSTVLLVAPSAHQRLRAPSSGIRRRSRKHLRITVWITIGGTIAFAIALVAAVFLVSQVVFSSTPAGLASAAVALTTVAAWFHVPLVTFQRLE